MDSFRMFLSQFGKIFNSLTFGKKITFLMVLAIAIGTMYYFANNARKANYTLLYGGLEPQDAGAIIEYLKTNGVDYIVENGNSIKVPSEKIYETRIALATEGLPQGGAIGFEIFDKTNFGVTDFVQKLNYTRALQGELQRTISQLKEVETARVHIAVPEKSLFVNEEKYATCSVVVKLQRGAFLSKASIDGIINLVSHSVEGLRPENVTLVDVEGNMLSTKAKDSETEFSDTQLAYKAKFEDSLERRVETMLEKTIGKNHVSARVTANFDFKKSEVMEESYDPDATAKRSEQEEIVVLNSSGAGAKGVPGSQSNLPEPDGTQSAALAAAKGESNQKVNNIVNYEVSKKVSKTINPTGVLQKLSVAVIVDGKYEKNDKGEQTYVPRTREEMTTIENIVKTAIGYDENREDQVSVANVAFQPDREYEMESGFLTLRNYDQIFNYVKILLVLFGIIMLFLFFVRPLAHSINESARLISETEIEAKVLEEKKALELEYQKDIEKANKLLEVQSFDNPEDLNLQNLDSEQKIRILNKKIAETVKSDPVKSARIIKTWLEDTKA